jgi:hypothetical protein
VELLLLLEKGCDSGELAQLRPAIVLVYSDAFALAWFFFSMGLNRAPYFGSTVADIVCTSCSPEPDGGSFKEMRIRLFHGLSA